MIDGKEHTMSDPTHDVATLHLTPDERALVIAALKLLRSTLGHEEAAELAEVQALLQRVERLAA